jgi:hypothetical protein
VFVRVLLLSSTGWIRAVPGSSAEVVLVWRRKGIADDGSTTTSHRCFRLNYSEEIESSVARHQVRSVERAAGPGRDAVDFPPSRFSPSSGSRSLARPPTTERTRHSLPAPSSVVLDTRTPCASSMHLSFLPRRGEERESTPEPPPFATSHTLPFFH